MCIRKSFLPRRFQPHLALYNRCFYSDLGECLSCDDGARNQKSTAKPQLYPNIMSESVFTQMTYVCTQSFNEFNSSMIFTIKNTLGDLIGLMNFRILFLKTPSWWRQFHSITAEGKKEIFEKIQFWKGLCF